MPPTQDQEPEPPHHFLIHVLIDLVNYAETHGLTKSAAALTSSGEVLSSEVHARTRESRTASRNVEDAASAAAPAKAGASDERGKGCRVITLFPSRLAKPDRAR
jgi:hypothetical protein